MFRFEIIISLINLTLVARCGKTIAKIGQITCFRLIPLTPR